MTKILKVDRWALEKGQSILIQGKTFVASEDDYLLIVSAAYGASEFDSLDELAVDARHRRGEAGYLALDDPQLG